MIDDIDKKNLIYVHKSDIHGFGVFAKKYIPKGSFITIYKGKIFNKTDDFNKDELISLKGIFTFEIDECRILIPFEKNNPAIFINHSCDENCEVIWNKKTQLLEIFAIKDIQKDEELSFDYGFSLVGFFEHPCKCGAKNCAKYIVAKTERPSLRKKLIRHRHK